MNDTDSKLFLTIKFANGAHRASYFTTRKQLDMDLSVGRVLTVKHRDDPGVETLIPFTAIETISYVKETS